MRLYRLATVVPVLAIVAAFGSAALGSAALGSAVAATAADVSGPQVVLHKSLLIKLGAVLSSSDPSASIPANITWTASDPSGICGSQWLGVYDAGEGYDEFELAPTARRFAVSGAGMETPWIGVSLNVEDCAGNATIAEVFYNRPSTRLVRSPTGSWSSRSAGPTSAITR